MTEYMIHLKCDQARADARRLRSIASDLREIVRSYERLLAEMAVAWSGSNCQSFMASVQSRVSNLSNQAGGLEGLAEAIEKTASVYEKTEIANLRSKAKSKK